MKRILKYIAFFLLAIIALIITINIILFCLPYFSSNKLTIQGELPQNLTLKARMLYKSDQEEYFPSTGGYQSPLHSMDISVNYDRSLGKYSIRVPLTYYSFSIDKWQPLFVIVTGRVARAEFNIATIYISPGTRFHTTFAERYCHWYGTPEAERPIYKCCPEGTESNSFLFDPLREPNGFNLNIHLVADTDGLPFPGPPPVCK